MRNGRGQLFKGGALGRVLQYSKRHRNPSTPPQPCELILPAMDLSLEALEAAARCWRPASGSHADASHAHVSACGATSTPMTSDGAVLFGDASLIDRSGENAAARSRAIADARWKESRPPAKRPKVLPKEGGRVACATSTGRDGTRGPSSGAPYRVRSLRQHSRARARLLFPVGMTTRNVAPVLWQYGTRCRSHCRLTNFYLTDARHAHAMTPAPRTHTAMSAAEGRAQAGMKGWHHAT